MTLPEGFADLEPFAAWCLASERERYERRTASTIFELREFYDAAFPRFADITAHLDRFPLDGMPTAERHLIHLMYSLISVSLAVDMFNQPQVVDCGNAVFFRTVEPAL